MSIPDPSHPAASFWRRIAAGIYDVFPVLAIWFAIGFLVVGLRGFRAVEPYTWWFELLLLLGTFVYFGFSWRRGGQTLGMRAWRIRLQFDAGTRPGWGLLALRFGMLLLALAPALIGVLWALFDPQRRMWHDIATHSRVVDATPVPRAK